MIFGLEPRHPLPENWTPLEAVAVVKCLDGDGNLALDVVSTTGVTGWEALGMLTAAAATETDDLREAFRPDDEEDD
jgi:hypothetical protein